MSDNERVRIVYNCGNEEVLSPQITGRPTRCQKCGAGEDKRTIEAGGGK